MGLIDWVKGLGDSVLYYPGCLTKGVLSQEFENYKEAKTYAREVRSTVEGEQISIKMNFADNQLLAEEQLLEHRDKPVTMEHEK